MWQATKTQILCVMDRTDKLKGTLHRVQTDEFMRLSEGYLGNKKVICIR